MLTPGMQVETTYGKGMDVRGEIVGAYRWSVTIKNEHPDAKGNNVLSSHHERWIRPVAGEKK